MNYFWLSFQYVTCTKIYMGKTFLFPMIFFHLFTSLRDPREKYLQISNHHFLFKKSVFWCISKWAFPFFNYKILRNNIGVFCLVASSTKKIDCIAMLQLESLLLYSKWQSTLRWEGTTFALWLIPEQSYGMSYGIAQWDGSCLGWVILALLGNAV